MVVKLANGTPVTKAGLDKTAFVADDPQFTINTKVFDHSEVPGDPSRTSAKLLWNAGQVVRQSEIDRAFKDAVISGISPAVGGTAGGTPFTITGTHLRGVTGITFGGTAATSVVVVNETTVTGVTPAKSAGAYNVVVTDDSGADTITNGFTYS